MPLAQNLFSAELRRDLIGHAATLATVTSLSFLCFTACREAPVANTPPAPAPEAIPLPRLTREMTTIPQRFASDDPQALYKELAAQERGPLEKTEAFRARQRALSQRPLVIATDQLVVTYDPDAEVATAELSIGAHFYMDQTRFFIAGRRRLVHQEHRSNAFGAQANVDVIQDDIAGLAIRGMPAKDRITSHAGSDHYEYFLPVPFTATAARATSLVDTGAVRAIFWCRPSAASAALTFQDHNVREATISNKRELTENTRGVYADMESVEVWLIDTTHGEIIQRAPLARLLAPPPPTTGKRRR